MSKNWYRVSLFASVAFAIWGCGDDSEAVTATDKVPDVKAQTESCYWVYSLASGEYTVDYEASCVEATIGDLDKEHCLGKTQGEIKSICETKEALASCPGIILDPDAGTVGTGYIYDAQMLRLLEINAELGETTVCEVFQNEFAK